MSETKMTIPDLIRQRLRVQWGIAIPAKCNDAIADEVSDLTSKIQALQAEIEILRRGLEFECGNRCAQQNPCNAKETLAEADQVRGEK